MTETENNEIKPDCEEVTAVAEAFALEYVPIDGFPQRKQGCLI